MKKILFFVSIFIFLCSCTSKRENGFLTGNTTPTAEETVSEELGAIKESAVAGQEVSVFKRFKRRDGFYDNEYEYYDKYIDVYIEQWFYVPNDSDGESISISTEVYTGTKRVYRGFADSKLEQLKETLEKEIIKALPKFEKTEESYGKTKELEEQIKQMKI